MTSRLAEDRGLTLRAQPWECTHWKTIVEQSAGSCTGVMQSCKQDPTSCMHFLTRLAASPDPTLNVAGLSYLSMCPSFHCVSIAAHGHACRLACPLVWGARLR